MSVGCCLIGKHFKMLSSDTFENRVEVIKIRKVPVQASFVIEEFS